MSPSWARRSRHSQRLGRAIAAVARRASAATMDPMSGLRHARRRTRHAPPPGSLVAARDDPVDLGPPRRRDLPGGGHHGGRRGSAGASCAPRRPPASTAPPTRTWPPGRLGRCAAGRPPRRWRCSGARAPCRRPARRRLSDCEAEGLAWADRLLDEVDPDTILTFGPDGMTYHSDHIAVHRWVTEAWQRRGRGRAALRHATVEHLATVRRALRAVEHVHERRAALRRPRRSARRPRPARRLGARSQADRVAGDGDADQAFIELDAATYAEQVREECFVGASCGRSPVLIRAETKPPKVAPGARPAVSPPSTTNSAPVEKLDSSLARNTIDAESSVGGPGRRRAMFCAGSMPRSWGCRRHRGAPSWPDWRRRARRRPTW